MKNVKRNLLTLACLVATISSMSVTAVAASPKSGSCPSNSGNCINQNSSCPGLNQGFTGSGQVGQFSQSNLQALLNQYMSKPQNQRPDQSCQQPSCPTDNTDNCKPNKPNVPPHKPGLPVVPDVPVQPDKPGDTVKPTAFEQEVARLVNQERAAAGLSALSVNTKVASAAQLRSKELPSSFSHTRPNGSSFSTALTEQGVVYRGSGENIAWGQTSPEQVMKGWMNSSGHRANILNKDFTQLGIGCYQDSNGTIYWTQLFTN